MKLKNTNKPSYKCIDCKKTFEGHRGRIYCDTCKVSTTPYSGRKKYQREFAPSSQWTKEMTSVRGQFK